MNKIIPTNKVNNHVTIRANHEKVTGASCTVEQRRKLHQEKKYIKKLEEDKK